MINTGTSFQCINVVETFSKCIVKAVSHTRWFKTVVASVCVVNQNSFWLNQYALYVSALAFEWVLSPLWYDSNEYCCYHQRCYYLRVIRWSAVVETSCSISKTDASVDWRSLRQTLEHRLPFELNAHRIRSSFRCCAPLFLRTLCLPSFVLR